ncbi:MAG TPA: (2Fe-2S)-binding protein [Prolixibacteraceae bacterium]|nr:(2Fe-2S)-binding protein [Prolixibacteraceae bacterium]
MNTRLVCVCNMVSENEIRTVLRKGARSTSDIQRMTRAGTSCGKCLVVIDGLVEEFLAKLPADPQQKINFGENQ